jgi:hypothetical protein
MKYALAILTLSLSLLGMVGCGKVHAQSNAAGGRAQIVNMQLDCPKGQHEIHETHVVNGIDDGSLYAGCVLDDGNPPRWIDPVDFICDEADWHNCRRPPPPHWECDKGYELDGFNVTWPYGIAKITPVRCKNTGNK